MTKTETETKTITKTKTKTANKCKMLRHMKFSNVDKSVVHL